MFKNLFFVCFIFCGMPPSVKADVLVDFEELNQFTASTPTGSYFNGNIGNGVSNSSGWQSGGAFFSNNYTNAGAFDFWDGWGYSNIANSTTPDFSNQYAVYAGGGSDGVGGIDAGGNYGLAFGNGALINLPGNMLLDSIEISNTTYAGISMRDGDSFAKKFGGTTGNDPDFFRVIWSGHSDSNRLGASTGNVVVYLADYRFANNAEDYIVNDWLSVDLSGLGAARSVSIQFESSDIGAFGVNTPTFVAIDQLRLISVPEPAQGVFLLVLTFSAVLKRRRDFYN